MATRVLCACTSTGSLEQMSDDVSDYIIICVI
jgi:hypothetical protein